VVRTSPWKLFAGLDVSVHNDRDGSLRSGGSHDRGANAFGSAGDEHDLIFKLQVHAALAIRRANSGNRHPEGNTLGKNTARASEATHPVAQPADRLLL